MSHMFRLKEYSLDEVFHAMDNRLKVLPDGEKVNLKSHRLILFRTKGVECVECGIKGSFFALETHDRNVNPHLNLYALDHQNKEVLMTKDHIHPRAHGGKNHVDNYQSMCSPCNLVKADTVQE